MYVFNFDKYILGISGCFICYVFKVGARKTVMNILEHFCSKYSLPQTREKDCLLIEIWDGLSKAKILISKLNSGGKDKAVGEMQDIYAIYSQRVQKIETLKLKSTYANTHIRAQA